MLHDLCLPAHRRAFFLALGAAVAIPVQAGRPLATDDAAVLEAGACQLETWAERARDSREAWLSAGCQLFGDTEFSLGGARVRPEAAASHTLTAWQFKGLLRPYGEDRSGFAVAVGDQRIRRGMARDAFVNGIATVPLDGTKRLLHLNLGALRMRDEDGRRTRATWSLAWDAEMAGATRAVIETFGATGRRANWQFALRHELVPERVQIDGSVGSAFGRWTETRVFTLGLVFAGPVFGRP